MGNYKISPHRRNGKYLVLPHEKYHGANYKSVVDSEEIEKNHKLFLRKKDRPEDMIVDGLSSLKYKIINKEKFMKKHWIYSVE